jgi:hypothetical protein
MSAWVVSDDHISYLVAAAVAYEGDRSFTRATPTDVGKIFLRQNINSVMHLYPDTPKERVMEYLRRVESYTYAAPVDLNPVVAIKLARSWQYQTNETSNYSSTLAWEMVERIIVSAINNLPGYEEAPWVI